MKSMNFAKIFLLAAVVIYLASGRGIFGSIILILASLFYLVELISKIWKVKGKDGKN